MNSKNTVNHNEFKPKDAILNPNSEFAVVEAYKAIRTNIMYSIPKTEGAKTIVVTSASAGEGKTTTCINLAQTFAQMNARVLLIDCDLRKPKVHRYLKVEKKDGLSNVVCGFAGLDAALKVNVRQNLDVLTSGENPPNPAELLQTKEFERVMAVLKKVYDYIIIDTPPINVVTDATSVIKHSSGVVLLIKKGHTTYDMIDEAMETLERIDANIIGTVLIDEKGAGRKNYKGYKGYKYGYQEKEEPSKKIIK
ncbi:MAG: CpsD/CapB family tyrosine-protein kinase [Clostridia bacterium]|nr:CpsD/CapB family tyrosine-protein kinase [Clostridia bacterium]